MKVPTIKMYKGRSEILVNKTDADIEAWNANGYQTSAQRKAAKGEDGSKDVKAAPEEKELSEKDAG